MLQERAIIKFSLVQLLQGFRLLSQAFAFPLVSRMLPKFFRSTKNYFIVGIQLLFVKYPLLHHSIYLLLGVLSIPLILLLFSYYFSLKIFFSFLVGILSGICANETWFHLIDKNFGLYKKVVRTRKGYNKILSGSFPLMLSYGVICLLSTFIFFSLGFVALLGIISGLCLTCMMYYESEKRFYKRL